jgi:hypothetical protein
LRDRCDGPGGRYANCVLSDPFGPELSCSNEPICAVYARANYGRSQGYSCQPDEVAIDTRDVPKGSGTTERMQCQEETRRIYGHTRCQQPIIGRSIPGQYQQTESGKCE